MDLQLIAVNEDDKSESQWSTRTGGGVFTPSDSVFATLIIGYASGTSGKRSNFVLTMTLKIKVATTNENSQSGATTLNNTMAKTENPMGNTVEHQQVTQYVDDSAVSVSTMGAQPSWKEAIPQTTLHDIRTILRRPVIVASGIWDNTDDELPLLPTDQNNVLPLVELDFPDALFATSQTIREKLSQFAYFSASIVVRVMVNGQPFQNGKMLGVVRPMYRGIDKDIARNSRTGLSGFPHGEVDVSEANSIEIKVPFCAPFSAWDLANYSQLDERTYTFQLFVLNSLDSGVTPSNCNYTVQAWFEDVTVTVPTAKRSNLIAANLVKSNTHIRRVKMAQTLFNDTQREIFTQVPAAGFTNVAPSGDVSLSLYPNDDIKQVQIETDKDYEKIAQITERQSILTTFNWNDSQILEEELFRVPAIPNVAIASASTFFPTILAYISSMFTFWQGSLSFRFSVAKTKYHSGRLRISYVPAEQSSTVTSFDHDQAFNIIWDLRESNECTMNVPFVYRMNMAPCNYLEAIDEPSHSFSPGTLIVTVLNPLIRPETVASSVPINVWMSSCDIQYAVNYLSDYLQPTVLGPPARKPNVKRIKEAQFAPGEELGNNEGKSGTEVLQLQHEANSSLVSKEQITHLSQILQRFTPEIPMSSTNMEFQPNWFSPINRTNFSLLSYVSMLFTFSRGSQKFKLASRDANDNLYAKVKFGIQDGTAPVTGTALDSIQGTNLHYVNTDKSNFLECVLPYYTNATVIANDLRSSAELYSPKISFNRTDTTNPAFVLRAGGSDFQFGFLVGAPAMVRNSNLETIDFNFANAVTSTIPPGTEYEMEITPPVEGLPLNNPVAVKLQSNLTFTIAAETDGLVDTDTVIATQRSDVTKIEAPISVQQTGVFSASTTDTNIQANGIIAGVVE